MNLQTHSHNRVTVLKVDGRIDASTVSKLRKRLQETIGVGAPFLVLDLTSVSFMDSGGLAALVQGMRQCRANGGDLCLCNPRNSVRMILELTRLDKAIEILPGETEAVEHLVTKISIDSANSQPQIHADKHRLKVSA